MSMTEQSTRESCRSDCYRLLAACFYPPETDQLLSEDTCRRLTESLKKLYPQTAAASFAAVMHQQLSVVTEVQLQVDHAALFLGPFELKAPPYGSVYLEKGRALMGKTTMAVSSRYAEAGLQLKVHEPADHIAVELEFMYYLAFLSAEAFSNGNRELAGELVGSQQRFLRDLLGAWVPALCNSIRCGAETVYFRALADCLEAFIGAELNFFNRQPAPAS